jgi:hypothetical protein
MAKLVKPNVTRGRIFDKIAETFGGSVLGMYDGKLRIEILDENDSPIQFSLAPVIHKTLVEEEECDKLIPIDDQIAAYNAAVAAKATTKSNASDKKDKPAPADDSSTNATGTVNVNKVPIEVSADEQAKLNELSNLVKNGDF